MNIGIVLSGGVGARFGSKVPKQYLEIKGKEVIFYAIDALKKSSVDEIIVVARGEQAERLSKKYSVKTTQGGDTRNVSLKNALDYVKANYECEKIIILEAARPMVTPELVNSYLKKLDEYDAVVTGQRIVDSLGCINRHVVDRNEYYLIQAPEAFNFGMLYSNFKAESLITATNQQMPENAKLYVNFDFSANYKITYPQDIAYCEAMMNANE